MKNVCNAKTKSTVSRSIDVFYLLIVSEEWFSNYQLDFNFLKKEVIATPQGRVNLEVNF